MQATGAANVQQLINDKKALDTRVQVLLQQIKERDSDIVKLRN